MKKLFAALAVACAMIAASPASAAINFVMAGFSLIIASDPLAPEQEPFPSPAAFQFRGVSDGTPFTTQIIDGVEVQKYSLAALYAQVLPFDFEGEETEEPVIAEPVLLDGEFFFFNAPSEAAVGFGSADRLLFVGFLGDCDCGGEEGEEFDPSLFAYDGSNTFYGEFEQGGSWGEDPIRIDGIDYFHLYSTGLFAVEDITEGVPEPATWTIFVIGFGAVGGAMRRRSTALSLAA